MFHFFEEVRLSNEGAVEEGQKGYNENDEEELWNISELHRSSDHGVSVCETVNIPTEYLSLLLLAVLAYKQQRPGYAICEDVS